MADFNDYDFNTILNNILTDYTNLDSSPDVSIGGQPWINGNVLASAVWGLYYFQDQYIKKQLFVDEADTENLNHWGSIFNVVRDSSDTNATYLNKIFTRLRQPPAGGNSKDFENWALDKNNCFAEYDGTIYYNGVASIVSNPGGALGWVGVYLIPEDETIPYGIKVAGNVTVPSPNKLIDYTASFLSNAIYAGDPITNDTNDTIASVVSVDSDTQITMDRDIFNSMNQGYYISSAKEILRRNTEDYIESVRPLGMGGVIADMSIPQNTIVNMNVTAPRNGSLDVDIIKTAIENYLNSHRPGENLYASRLEYIAIANGAYSAQTTIPSIEETVINDNVHVRSGTVTITEV